MQNDKSILSKILHGEGEAETIVRCLPRFLSTSFFSQGLSVNRVITTSPRIASQALESWVAAYSSADVVEGLAFLWVFSQSLKHFSCVVAHFWEVVTLSKLRSSRWCGRHINDWAISLIPKKQLFKKKLPVNLLDYYTAISA